MKGSRGGAGDGFFSEIMTDGRRDGLRVAAIGMLSGVLYVVGSVTLPGSQTAPT